MLFSCLINLQAMNQSIIDYVDLTKDTTYILADFPPRIDFFSHEYSFIRMYDRKPQENCAKRILVYKFFEFIECPHKCSHTTLDCNKMVCLTLEDQVDFIKASIQERDTTYPISHTLSDHCWIDIWPKSSKPYNLIRDILAQELCLIFYLAASATCNICKNPVHQFDQYNPEDFAITRSQCLVHKKCLGGNFNPLPRRCPICKKIIEQKDELLYPPCMFYNVKFGLLKKL